MQLSSSALAWPDLVVEQHIAPGGERPETVIDPFLICLWQAPARCEHANSRGVFSSRSVQPGAITWYAPGAIAPVHPFTECSFLLCALDRRFIHGVRDEMKDEGTIRPQGDTIVEEQARFNDPALRKLLLLLQLEVRRGGVTGPMYAEALRQAVAGRFLMLTHTHDSRRRPTPTLPSTGIRRLRERMEETPSAHFDLDTLAAESGYSKRHFLRAFRARTGFTPHQYVLHLRLQRAKQLMSRRSLSLLEIALESGFSSQAHFSHTFRQRFGVSPSEFRRAQ